MLRNIAGIQDEKAFGAPKDYGVYVSQAGLSRGADSGMAASLYVQRGQLLQHLARLWASQQNRAVDGGHVGDRG